MKKYSLALFIVTALGVLSFTTALPAQLVTYVTSVGNVLTFHTGNGIAAHITLSGYTAVTLPTSGNVVSDANGGLTPSGAIISTSNASTTGTVTFSEPFQTVGYKVVQETLTGFTGHATLTYPIAFAVTNVLVSPSISGVTNAISNTSNTLTAASAESGVVIIQGN